MGAPNAVIVFPLGFPRIVGSEQRQPADEDSSSLERNPPARNAIEVSMRHSTPLGSTHGQCVVVRKTSGNGDRKEGGPQAPMAQ